VPANEIALDLGNLKVANMVMLGAYLKAVHPVGDASVIETFHKLFTGAKEKLIPMNEEALKRGAESVQ
jgi:2-oxoglutarate ferredoxin oxidoreductase subunit gamma